MNRNQPQTLTKEQWNIVGDRLEEFSDMLEEFYRMLNYDGLGEQATQEWLPDLQTAIAAVRYVADRAADKLHFLLVSDTDNIPN